MCAKGIKETYHIEFGVLASQADISKIQTKLFREVNFEQ